MNVEEQLGFGAKVGNRLRAESQIRDEVAVHYVDVEPTGSHLFDRAHVIGKTRVVGC